MINDGEDITPEGSVAPVFLVPTKPEPTSPAPADSLAETLALQAQAVQKVMDKFGLTEDEARAVLNL